MSNRQYSDSLRVGVLLAITGGFLDAYTYIGRGKVFANAQTGNMVMLGLSLIEGKSEQIFKYIIPVVAFAIGVLLAEIIRGQLTKSEKIHWRQAVIAIEVILLIIVSFIKYDYVANIIISLICAMQVESFRKFHGNAYATTMCTGNLRSGTEKLVIFIRNKDLKHLKVSFQYYFIIFIFCLGATIGGIATLSLGNKAVLITIMPLILSLIIMWKK